MTISTKTAAGAVIAVATALAIAGPGLAYAGGTSEQVYSHPPTKSAPMGGDRGGASNGSGDMGDRGSGSGIAPSGTTACDVGDIELDLTGLEGLKYRQGTEQNHDGTSGGLRYDLQIMNVGTSTCLIMQNQVTLTVSGAGSKICTPSVQGIVAKPGVPGVLSAAHGDWGTCVSSAVKRAGVYQVRGAVSIDGVTTRSEVQSFVAVR